VADIRQYPNLADLKANEQVTDESPSGHDRGRRPAPAADHLRPPQETRRFAKTG